MELLSTTRLLGYDVQNDGKYDTVDMYRNTESFLKKNHILPLAIHIR